MKTVQHILKQRLAAKHMGKQSIWALTIETLRKHAQFPADFAWYVRGGIVYLRVDPAEDKLKRFTTKEKRLQEAVQALADFGYQVPLRDLRIR